MGIMSSLPKGFAQPLIDHHQELDDELGWLKSDDDSVYINEDNLKNIKSMATTKTNSIFDRMMAKYMAQYKPEKVAGLAMTMDGNIALASGEGEFTAIVDDRLEVYPTEAVLTDIPFFSLQRPINQVKIGDYIFITTGEGRKLAKVTSINKTKDGSVKSLTVARFSGTTDETIPSTDKLTGISTVEVVINFFKDLQFPGMGDGQQNPLVAFAMMKEFMGGSGDSSMEKLLMMSMFMGGGLNLPGMTFPGMGNGQQNPLMTMALMKEFMGNKSDSGFEKLLMMSMFMGGNNPFTQMVAPAAPTRAPRKPAKKTDPAPDPAPDPTQEPAGEDEQ